jgi:hypothetical protein
MCNQAGVAVLRSAAAAVAQLAAALHRHAAVTACSTCGTHTKGRYYAFYVILKREGTLFLWLTK